MLNWSDAAVTARMREGWRGGLPEGTPCGTGSLERHTRNVRAWVPDVMRRYNLRTICDAGAGDMCWAKDALADFDYRPFDLVPRSAMVTRLDITKDRLPQCDVILCRHVLIHLNPDRVKRALDLFSQAARYLLASQYDVPFAFDPGNQFNRTNLVAWPYDLGRPLESIQDGEEDTCSLALWELSC